MHIDNIYQKYLKMYLHSVTCPADGVDDTMLAAEKEYFIKCIEKTRKKIFMFALQWGE